MVGHFGKTKSEFRESGVGKPEEEAQAFNARKATLQADSHFYETIARKHLCETSGTQDALMVGVAVVAGAIARRLTEVAADARRCRSQV